MERNEGYKCPACGKALAIVQINETEVEACTQGCGGIWLDAAELFRIDEEGEADDSPVMQKLLSFNTPRDTENRDKLSCMKCECKMRRHEYREGSGIYIDECYGCGGIWLDGGELKAIRENPVVARSNQEREQLAKDFSRRVQEEARRLKEEEKRRHMGRNRRPW